LLDEVRELAGHAIFGTLSESYRTCGTPTCRCHHGGPKHGPHLYISYRGDEGKTTGYYVPKAAQQSVSDGVAAWQTLQQRLRQLAELNKDKALKQAKKEQAK
jgi:hypothetical protein